MKLNLFNFLGGREPGRGGKDLFKNLSFLSSTRSKVFFFSVFSAIALIVLFWVNIYFLAQRKVTFQELITTLSFNTIKRNQEIVRDSLEIAPIQRAVWICLATFVGAVALVISGACVQALTQNPLADPTTLGFISSTIFGIIFLKGMVTNVVEASNYHFFYFLFALIGGIVTLVILGFLFRQAHNKVQHLKIILIGLVLNMIFKTLTYLVKSYNSNAVMSSFKLAMGGAENIYGLYSYQFVFLKWCFLGLLAIFFVCFMCSQKMNLFELGEEQAKTLGVNVKVFKYLGYTMALLSSTIAICLVGNVAFLGIISTHSVRSFLRTKKYQIIIPVASLLSAVLFFFGILLNSLLPFISSSIFILFLGGCVLLFLTLKEKSL